MTIQPTITCAPLFEPRKDIVAAGETAVGVQLNFELLEEPQGAEDPEAEFRKFLEELPGLTFALYRRSGNNLILDAAASLTPIDETKPDSKADPIIEWLKTWKLEGVPPWHATRSEEELHDPAKVSAGQRLAGAQGWVAPLPQQAGLTRILALSAGQDGAGCRYIVPYREQESAEPSIEIEIEGEGDPDLCRPLEFTHPYGWGKIVAAPLLGANADGTLQIDATGFLRANTTMNDDANVVALMRRIRERTGSLFWTAPHLASFEFPPVDDNPDYGDRLVWRAAATLCAVLDPLFLALSMASGKRREGPFVGEAAMAIVDVDGALFGQIGNFVDGVSTWVKDTAAASTTTAGFRHFLRVAADLLENPALFSARLSSPPRDSDKLDLQLIDAEPALLPLLLAVPGSGWEWGDKVDFAALEERLSAELAALVGQLGSEGGIEASALAFFRHAEYGRKIIDKLFPPVPVAPGSPDAERREREAQAEAVSKVDTVLARLAARLGDNYDGLAAARIAVGSLFAERVPQFSDRAGGTRLPADFAAVQTLVDDSNWFARRCRAVADVHPFADLAAYLPQPGGLMPLGKDRDNFVGELTKAFADAAADLVAGLGNSARRFQPDSEPPPLPVRLTIDSDTGDGDIFDQCYDGVGVLVQRGDEPWAHANLALLTKRIADGPDFSSDPTILPLLPAEVDGARVLVLEYNGRPFAANDAPYPSDADENSQEQPFDPYHSHRALPDPAAAGHAKLPALAYGTRYYTAAFAVSRSSVLPEAIAESGKLHVPAIKPKPPGADYYTLHEYSRTTAIGDVGFDRAPADRAFAAPVQKISLLSSDYPRIGMTCASGATRYFDMWRGSDGAGLIPLPEADNETIELNLHDVLVTGDSPIRVSIHGNPADAGATDGIELSAAEFSGDVKLTITRKNLIQVELSVAGQSAMLDDCASGWVRLAFVEPVGHAAVRLADPTGAIGGAIAGTAGASAATLVLRPDEPNVWNADFATGATAKVRFPAMTLADMDRWLENKTLCIEAAAGYAKIDKFRVDLLTVGLDLALAKNVEKLLSVLPDMAVSGLLAELVVLDELGNAVPTPALAPAKITVPRLGRYLEDLNYDAKKLPEFLRKLAEKHCAAVEVKAGSSASLIWVPEDKVLKVSLPAGHTARLSFRRLVPERYFQSLAGATPVLGAGLQQSAIGRYDTSLVFDGPSLTIEVMDEVAPTGAFLEALAGSALSVMAVGGARSYQLQFDPQQLTLPHRHEWRALGSAEVGEQRWRFLGRPIHNWFNPKDGTLRHPRKVGDPAAVFWLRDDAAIAAFEQEAFDAQATPIAGAAQLRPLGEISQLSRVQWDEPSATMFRHRVSVLGRYAGAMLERRAHVVIGKHKEPYAQSEWLRVAVLAERSRIELTPPQLRALLPLNRAQGSGVTPPLVAMLAERPFAHGGLADRIASGVVTGLGYDLPPAPDKLAIKDARQEFGPDPQLSYYPLKENHSLAMTFAGEGPVGLTFDSPNAPAPAYANSAWVLTPEALLADQSDADWQEHFVAVSMRRYLDPNWLTDPEPDTSGYDFGETRWFELDGPNSLKCVIDSLEIGLLKIERIDDSWTVAIQAKALLPEGNEHWLPIATINAPGIARLALLHQRLEAGRAALSVFALEDPGTDATRALPRLVAGCEWRCNPGAVLKLVFETNPVEAHRTSASPPAAMEWARTGRNAEKLQVRAAVSGQRWPVKTLDMAELWLKAADTDNVTFHDVNKAQVWPCPSLTDAANPLYVHRVLALLQTDRTAGSHSVETFSQKCHLVFGSKARFPAVGEDKVARLLELELPARPFGASALAEFDSAVFYLEEIGESGATGGLLMVRPLDRPQGQSVLFTTEFGIKKFKIMLPRPTTERSRAVLVVIAAQAETCVAWMMDGEGNVIDLATETLPEGESKDVTIKAECTEEWWADASLLTLGELPNKPEALSLDFAWLFGKDTPEIKTSLSHDGLRAMVAAQARIISVSPPLSWSG